MPQQCVIVESGLSIWLNDPRYATLVLPRSGTGIKRGLVLGNGTGLIDSDYQGRLYIAATNRTNDTIRVDPMERIAQMVVVPVISQGWEVVEAFDKETKRGTGGHGSTGTH